MAYKLLQGQEEILHVESGITFPPGDNRFYQEYLAWLTEGNTPEPADPQPPPSSEEVARVGARAWYIAHPPAQLLFTESIPDLETRIDNMDLTTAAGRNQLKLLLKTLAIAVRVLAKREGLINGA